MKITKFDLLLYFLQKFLTYFITHCAPVISLKSIFYSADVMMIVISACHKTFVLYSKPCGMRGLINTSLCRGKSKYFTKYLPTPVSDYTEQCTLKSQNSRLTKIYYKLSAFRLASSI